MWIFKGGGQFSALRPFCHIPLSFSPARPRLPAPALMCARQQTLQTDSTPNQHSTGSFTQQQYC